MNLGYTYVLRTPVAGLTVSTAITLLQLKAGAAAPIEILRATVTQRGSVTSVQEALVLLRKNAAATLTNASVLGTNTNTTGTLNNHNPKDPAPASQVTGTGNLASAEGTDGDILSVLGFNVLNGAYTCGTPEERFWVPAGGIIAVKFLTAPASQLWHGEIVFREYQG